MFLEIKSNHENSIAFQTGLVWPLDGAILSARTERFYHKGVLARIILDNKEYFRSKDLSTTFYQIIGIEALGIL